MNPDDFIDRYAQCPLCHRNNVRLRYYNSSVVFAEHPMGEGPPIDNILISAHPDPIDPGAAFNPRAMEATYARVRCPASLAPIMPLEEP